MQRSGNFGFTALNKCIKFFLMLNVVLFMGQQLSTSRKGNPILVNFPKIANVECPPLLRKLIGERQSYLESEIRVHKTHICERIDNSFCRSIQASFCKRRLLSPIEDNIKGEVKRLSFVQSKVMRANSVSVEIKNFTKEMPIGSLRVFNLMVSYLSRVRYECICSGCFAAIGGSNSRCNLNVMVTFNRCRTNNSFAIFKVAKLQLVEFNPIGKNPFEPNSHFQYT